MKNKNVAGEGGPWGEIHRGEVSAKIWMGVGVEKYA